MPRVLYIHGYASSGNGHTAQTLRELLGDRLELIAPDFPAEPMPALAKAEAAVIGMDMVVASSYGAFIALNLSHCVPTLLINPCIYPSHELPLLDTEVDADIVACLKSMESQLFCKAAAKCSIMHAVFADNDELFSYKDEYLKYYSNIYKVHGGHSLDYDTIKTTVVPLIEQLTHLMP
ncbi:MAG: hypothetical protein LBV04_08190 [Deferribacteraceae bacterium]|jgi:predicted esterase YcpF (UPF0227 family)|nr:hypothetical protein [Deferribacteraceae bacterium]